MLSAPANSLCSSFQLLSKLTWSELRKARSVGFPRGETGITDYLLVELKRRHPREVTVYPFTQRQEVLTGADWEWWFVGTNNQSVGFRIQAKVLHYNTRRYNSLHYRIPSSGTYQTDQLIKNSLSSNPRTIPLYCLYTEWARSPNLRQWNCGSFGPRREQLGCSLVTPFRVRRLRKPNPKDSLLNVFGDLHPWQCLVCCQVWGSNLPTCFALFSAGVISRERST